MADGGWLKSMPWIDDLQYIPGDDQINGWWLLPCAYTLDRESGAEVAGSRDQGDLEEG